MDYVGIDLGCSAASGRASSAVAILDADGAIRFEPIEFRRAGELVTVLSGYNPGDIIIAVDAPRSVPDHAQENYAYRSCERGAKAVDPGAGSFVGGAALYLRWYEIESRWFARHKVIETYPRVVWKRLGLPGKPKEFNKNRGEVWAAVERVTGVPCDGFSAHQVDALLCAYTALCYGRGEVEWFGEPGEGLIVIPSPGRPGRPSPDEERIDERFRRFPCMGTTGVDK